LIDHPYQLQETGYPANALALPAVPFACMLYVTEANVATLQLNGSVKEPNKFHNYETEKITRKASDVAEYIELFGSSTRDRHARRINVIL